MEQETSTPAAASTVHQLDDQPKFSYWVRKRLAEEAAAVVDAQQAQAS